MSGKIYTLRTTKQIDTIVSYFKDNKWEATHKGSSYDVDERLVYTNLKLSKDGNDKNIRVYHIPFTNEEQINKTFCKKTRSLRPIFGEDGRYLYAEPFEYYSFGNAKTTFGFNNLIKKCKQSVNVGNRFEFMFGDLRQPETNNYTLTYSEPDEFGIVTDKEINGDYFSWECAFYDLQRKFYTETLSLIPPIPLDANNIRDKGKIKLKSNLLNVPIKLINNNNLEEIDLKTNQRVKFSPLFHPISISYSKKEIFNFEDVDLANANPLDDNELQDLKNYLNPAIEKEAKIKKALLGEEMRRKWRKFDFSDIQLENIETEYYEYLITQLKAFLYDNSEEIELKKLLENAKKELAKREYDNIVFNFIPNKELLDIKNKFSKSKILKSGQKTMAVLEFIDLDTFENLDIYLEKIIRFGN